MSRHWHLGNDLHSMGIAILFSLYQIQILSLSLSQMHINRSYYPCYSLLDANAYDKLLKQFICANDICRGRILHGHIIKSGAGLLRGFLANRFIEMYSKCGNARDARQVFDLMPDPSEFSWNAMITGYFKCGDASRACVMFHKMPESERSRVTWNALISGLDRLGTANETLGYYTQMLAHGFLPDSFTFASLLSSCTRIGDTKFGRKVHAHIIKCRLDADIFVGSGLISMYSKTGEINVARRLFDNMPARNVAVYNTLIVGYGLNGLGKEALQLFYRTKKLGVSVDHITYISVLGSCARSGMVEEARHIFDEMPCKSVSTWNAMIAGYAQNGKELMAVTMFLRMFRNGFRPDEVGLATVFTACSSLALLDVARQLHGLALTLGLQMSLFVGNGLIHAYSKCGFTHDAWLLFEGLPHRNLISWNAMIAGFAQNGLANAALGLFHEMLEAHIMPNYVTFLSVLHACSHSGLLDKGLEYFECMSRDYNIEPVAEHYSCMIDLLGRAGRFEEAIKMMRNAPFEATSSMWGAMLGACKIHTNLQLGEWAAHKLFEMDPKSSGPYVLLANMYAAARSWPDVARIRKLMRDRGVNKKPGWSWIEIHNVVHHFVADDTSHPQTDQIYALLGTLQQKMVDLGYVADIECDLHHVAQHEKHSKLGYHSEKLAIAFGLLYTSAGTPIRVMKNLRICVDCHNAAKFISRIVDRHIIVRDINRFHHFRDGNCSCGNYW